MMINTSVNEYVKRSLHKKLKYNGGRETSLFLCLLINTYMKDKKAAKLILKRAKKNPLLYSTADLFYAKKVKNLIKNDLLHQETEQSQQ